MPMEETEVLIYSIWHGTKGITIAEYQDGEWSGYGLVTHWMPLPEPPEDKK